MSELTIGRVGLDVAITRVAEWREVRGNEAQDITVSGFLRSSSVANTMNLRTQLLGQTNSLVAVTYDDDPYLNGFFWLAEATVGTIPASYMGAGMFPFEATLIRLGTAARIELQSLITFTVLDNNHGIDQWENEAFHALPGTHYLYNGNANLGSVARTTETGTVRVYRQIQIVAGPTINPPDPIWSIDPDDFYDGAAYIKVDGNIQTGLDVPHEPGDWELGNGLIKVTPAGTASRLNVAQWDTSAYATAKSYTFTFDDDGAGGSAPIEVPAHKAFAVIRNDPECVIIRLISDNATTGGANAHYFDLTMRRGAAFVVVYWNYTWPGGTSDLKVVRSSTEAASTVTPTGASGAVGIRATSNDADGNRYVMGTRHTHTADTTNGGMTRSNASNTFHFFLGSEINGSSASSGNAAADLCLQYLGWVSEKVRAVLR